MKCSMQNDSGAPRFTAMQAIRSRHRGSYHARLGDTQPCLDQRADRRAETRTDGHIVVELRASKAFGMRPRRTFGLHGHGRLVR